MIDSPEKIIGFISTPDSYFKGVFHCAENRQNPSRFVFWK